MNNSVRKNVEIKLDFLPSGNFEAETWADTKNSDKVPAEKKKSLQKVKNGDTFKISLAENGGFVALIKPSDR
jgi:hypothetical protein